MFAGRTLRCMVLCVPVVALIGCPQITGKKTNQASSDEAGPHIANRDAIAKYLPNGLKLEDRIPVLMGDRTPTSTGNDGRKTVEQYLLDYGAHIGTDNKLYDKQKLEIVFVVHYHPGTRSGTLVSGKWVYNDFENYQLIPSVGKNQRAIVYKNEYGQ
jgi:hypothetical protein